MITDLIPELKRFLGLYNYLNQADVWVDRHDVVHDIGEMSVRYKTNCIRFMERRAKRLADIYGWGEVVFMGQLEANMSELTVDLLEQQMHEDEQRRDADPVAWLRSTPLIARLIADVEAGRGGTDGDQPVSISPGPKFHDDGVAESQDGGPGWPGIPGGRR